MVSKRASNTRYKSNIYLGWMTEKWIVDPFVPHCAMCYFAGPLGASPLQASFMEQTQRGLYTGRVKHPYITSSTPDNAETHVDIIRQKHVTHRITQVGINRGYRDVRGSTRELFSATKSSSVARANGLPFIFVLFFVSSQRQAQRRADKTKYWDSLDFSSHQERDQADLLYLSSVLIF